MNEFIEDFIEGFKMALDIKTPFTWVNGWSGLNPLSYPDGMAKGLGKLPGKAGETMRNNPKKVRAATTGATAIALAALGLAGDAATDSMKVRNLQSGGMLPLEDIATEYNAYLQEQGLHPDITIEDIRSNPALLNKYKINLMSSHRADGVDIPNYNLAWDQFMGVDPAKASNYGIGRSLYRTYADDGWNELGYKHLFGDGSGGELFKSDGSKEQALKAMQQYLDTVNYIMERGKNYPKFANQAQLIKNLSGNGNMSVDDRESVYKILEEALLDQANGKYLLPSPDDNQDVNKIETPKFKYNNRRDF
ncbi:hypothetical protein [Succinimonas amylolytica]|uniref:hypothetical protein n=1 Tax=Succinimonas amylolytica TaxID=83769 RepID=UPI00037A3C49|nr:hypothetical protein [Succinimonas amylolytica]